MSEMEKKKNKAAGGRKRKKKIPLIVAAALVVVFGGYSVVNSVIAKNTPTQVNTITAAKGSVEETISTSGKVNSEQSRTYYAPVGAVITEMNVSLGDVVEEGQQLVTFDTSDLEAQKTKAALDASASANGYRSTQYQSDKKQSEYNEAVIGLDELKVLAAGQEQYVQGLKYNLEDDIQNKKEDLQEWLNKLNLELEIQYKLVRSGLMIRYSASTDAPTVCNLTNHSYFNLNGHASGTALGHRISVDADAYLETDDTSVPTGRKIPVAGTPMDFTEEKTLGLDIEADYPALKQALGYDHCYIIRDTGLRHAAWATGPLTGIRMEVLTTLPGMHLYSANYLEPLTDCKDGAHYQKRDAICFETEEFPDAPNHPEFPDTTVLPGPPVR